MDIIKLKARLRNGSGKSYTRKCRVQGWIPAIYYGHGQNSQNIEIDAKDFSTILRARKTTHLIDLGSLLASGESLAVIKEIQRDVILTDQILHIDFQHVDKNEKVTTKVPLQITGEALGVKLDGGILSHPIRMITIECLPLEIPDHITIDVSELKIGDSIHVRDLKLTNVTIKDSPDEVLAVVTMPTREEEVKPVVDETAIVEGADATAPVGAPATGPGAVPAAGAAKPEAGKETKEAPKKEPLKKEAPKKDVKK